MSARSTSVSGRSWSGDERAPADIIDLDKFMRGAVRPSRRHDSETRRDKLVVDAGGVERKIAAVGKLGSSGAPTSVSGAPLVVAGPAAVMPRGEYTSSSRSTLPPPQAKRFSHDSGLSDGSYKKRKQRPLRRATVSEASRKTNSAARTVAGGASSDSLRAFRAVCERALLDQQVHLEMLWFPGQVQIARVAELCERLSERQKPPPAPAPAPPPPAPHKSESSQRTTDETSSTQSSRSRDLRRKEKHRNEECKTYKIIMNKLDELNRLFASRAASPHLRAPPAPRVLPPSSGSVSVSDKLVSTEPTLLSQYEVTVSSMAQVPRNPRMLTNARAPLRTERVVVGDSAATFGSGCDARCGFDLEDPIHLYSQAKRLQALPVLKRRARSVEPALEQRFSERFGAHIAARAGRCEPRDTTLCALCRGYWRTFRKYISTQIFCYPSDNY
ncbi:unnamed protein product [Arctia plantaginis]|uniref:Uncharacterized protein n=1 Tax=Arctia plantaginis TaxID=874455 RepID=A0A8S1AL55_ARCPL|nr:unnamed protein product [Arctia plantaginis]